MQGCKKRVDGDIIDGSSNKNDNDREMIEYEQKNNYHQNQWC